jgi:outer membrane murein-binding lipoprotein Lpp
MVTSIRGAEVSSVCAICLAQALQFSLIGGFSMSSSLFSSTKYSRGGIASLAAILLSLAFLGGCASSGTVADLNKRLDSIDQRLDGMSKQLDATEARAEAAETNASNAVRRAEMAETNVRAAAAQADMAAQKAAAAFDKTVRK